MSRVIDVTVNFRPHTDLGLYEYLGISAESSWSVEPESFIADMDAAGVEKAGLIANVVANGVGGEVYRVTPDEVAGTIRDYPERFFGWVGVNPVERMAAVREIDYAVTQLGFKGVHVYPHWFGLPVNDRVYYPLYSKCAELGVPIALQVGTPSMRSRAKCVAQPILLDDVASDFPELKLIGLHIGVPWTHEMTMLAQNWENVYIIADAHPPNHWDADLVDYIKESAWTNKDGSRKVMWGTDWPVQDAAASLAQLAGLGLDEETERLLVGDNAMRVLDL